MSKVTVWLLFVCVVYQSATTILAGGERAASRQRPCQRERGLCVSYDGRDQNSGVIKLNNVDGNTRQAQATCLKLCWQQPGATGCEVIWHQENRGCYAHTKTVAYGNGADRHMCWAFRDCSAKIPYMLNGKNNCWWTCKGGPCPKICGWRGYCCRKGHKGCPSDMTAVAPNYHTCIRYKAQVPYVLNGKNNCWGTCQGGPCSKICGLGGYCCRKYWGGCPFDMTVVAPNYHTCIRYKQGKAPVPYVLNGKNNCWWHCRNGGPCSKVCGSGGYCCRKGRKGCPSDMTAVATPNHHTCIKYRQG